jgi:hypothetical protein
MELIEVRVELDLELRPVCADKVGQIRVQSFDDMQ